jgi:hypothetical protein
VIRPLVFRSFLALVAGPRGRGDTPVSVVVDLGG